MDRLAASVYLSGPLGLTATELGVASGPLSSIWDMAIDDALLSLSADPGALATAVVPSAQVIAYRALLTYHGLSRLHEAALAGVDVSIDGPQMSKKHSQAVEALERRIAIAKKDAAQYATAGPLASDGYGDFGSFNTGYMNLNESEF